MMLCDDTVVGAKLTHISSPAFGIKFSSCLWKTNSGKRWSVHTGKMLKHIIADDRALSEKEVKVRSMANVETLTKRRDHCSHQKI